MTMDIVRTKTILYSDPGSMKNRTVGDRTVRPILNYFKFSECSVFELFGQNKLFGLFGLFELMVFGRPCSGLGPSY